jgi:hypothetical protein
MLEMSRRFMKIGHPLRLALVLTAIWVGGCDSALEPLVGRKSPEGPKSTAATPSLTPPIAAFMTGSELTAPYTGQGFLPPTLPMEAPEESVPEPIASGGPHPAIASVPLSSDAAQLAPLSAAARARATGPDSRFVLLVLTPPASDAATLDRTNTTARTAASAAVKALGDAGVQSDRIEVSMATNPDVGSGEMRLYVR